MSWVPMNWPVLKGKREFRRIFNTGTSATLVDVDGDRQWRVEFASGSYSFSAPCQRGAERLANAWLVEVFSDLLAEVQA